jgi:hypothetical protein
MRRLDRLTVQCPVYKSAVPTSPSESNTGPSPGGVFVVRAVHLVCIGGARAIFLSAVPKTAQILFVEKL